MDLTRVAGGGSEAKRVVSTCLEVTNLAEESNSRRLAVDDSEQRTPPEE